MLWSDFINELETKFFGTKEQLALLRGCSGGGPHVGRRAAPRSSPEYRTRGRRRDEDGFTAKGKHPRGAFELVVGRTAMAKPRRRFTRAF